MPLREKLKALTQERTALIQQLNQLDLDYYVAIKEEKEYEELKKIKLSIRTAKQNISSINLQIEDLLKEPT